MIVPVVAGIIQTGRKYGEVMIRRHGAVKCENPELNDYYEFVGGKVREGETLENALIREIREETGIELEDKDSSYKPQVVYAQIHKYDHNSNYYLVVYMECFPKRIIAEGEISDSVFVELDNVKDYKILPGTYEALSNI